MIVVNNLSDLKNVSKTLKAEAKKQEEARKRELERRKKQEQDANFFAHAMREAGVERMAQKNLADVKRPKPQPVLKNPSQAVRPPARDTLSDEADPDTFLTDGNELYNWRKDVSPDIPRKLYRGFWTVQAWLDLHGYAADEARQHLVDFLTESARRGYRCLRIVHGVGYNSAQGQGKLKVLVPRWLKQRPDVMAFVRSPVEQGDQGALLVLLEGRKK